MQKLSRNAAIAQSVERILGKDEVASSNLASSSKTKRPSVRVVFLFWTRDKFEPYKCKCPGDTCSAGRAPLTRYVLPTAEGHQIWLAAPRLPIPLGIGSLSLLCCSVYGGFAFPEQRDFTRRLTASLLRSKGCGFASPSCEDHSPTVSHRCLQDRQSPQLANGILPVLCFVLV